MRSIMIVMLALVACQAAGARKPTAIEWSRVDIAQGGGTKGPWRQNESDFDYVDDPSAAIAADGSIAVAWVDHRDKDVHLQRFARDGKPVGEPVNVSRSADVFSWLPRVVIAKRDVLVIWQEIVFSGGSHGGEIFFARSTDRGATFAAPINLSNSLGGDGKGRITEKIWHNGSLDLAVAPDGTLHAAWTEYDGPLWFTSSRDGGKTFAPPQQVAGTKAEPARGPSLAISADGAVLLAWTFGENDAADIHVARLAGDRFTTPVRVANTTTYSDAPKLAFDRAGTLHVAFTETTGGPFDRPRIHHARSRDGGKTFEAPASVADSAAYPALAVDGAQVIVLWDVIEDDRDARGLGLAVSRDGGAHWTKTPALPYSRDPAGGTNGSHQGHLMNKLAVRDGAIVVVNASLAAGKASRVWMLRGRLPR
jgi:hypothetical protein